MTSAITSPAATGVMWSSVPWMTSVGQVMRWSRATTSSLDQSSNGARTVAVSTSPLVPADQAMASSICLVECGSLHTWRQKKSVNRSKSVFHTCSVNSPHPCGSSSTASNECIERSGRFGTSSGMNGAIITAPRTRSGCSAATPAARPPPCDRPAITARSVLVSSRTAMTSAISSRRS